MNFLMNNKTKALGVVTVILGFVQAYPGLSDLLSARAYAWVMFFIGIGVTVCGFLNSGAQPTTTNGGNQNGNARVSIMAVLAGISLLSVMVLSAGCAAINPVAKAETSEQRAYALYGSFVVFEEQAAKVVQQPDVPQGVKDALRAADAAAKPLADKLIDAAQAVFEVRLDLEAGTTTKDKLRIALENLDRYITEAGPKIKALAGALKEAT